MGAAMLLKGQDAVKGKWPFVVALLHQDGVVKCSGVLLNSRWVLTAGHCISQLMSYISKYSTYFYIH